jgi:hypothetical protein
MLSMLNSCSSENNPSEPSGNDKKIEVIFQVLGTEKADVWINGNDPINAVQLPWGIKLAEAFEIFAEKENIKIPKQVSL